MNYEKFLLALDEQYKKIEKIKMLSAIKNDICKSPVKRIASGINGLDGIIGGGIPEHCSVVLAGSFGVGKTTAAVGFLIEGALKAEKGLYISVDNKNSLIHAQSLDWPLKKLIDEGSIVVKNISEYGANSVITFIMDAFHAVKPKRLVIDSLCSENISIEEREKLKSSLTRALNELNRNKCTTMIISEKSCDTCAVEEHVSDAVIHMVKDTSSDYMARTLRVVKMCSTAHSLKKHYFSISNNGIRIKH